MTGRPLRIAIVGYGRMGRAVAGCAASRGHTVLTVVEAEDNVGGAGLTPARLAGVDVAVEFTRPASVAANLERLIEAGVPVVTGTTGWAEQMEDVRRLVTERKGAVLVASNFSIGAQVFFRAARELARLMRGRPEFDGFIVEAHHRAKLDAPSGTALSLQAAARGADPERAYAVTSIRAGAIPGTHTLAFDAPLETIRLEHEARDRSVFADGAVAAAEWLAGRTGFYTFEDMLFGSER
jgi:4-hydroxy-tetrahydrodipicolinate reductase